MFLSGADMDIPELRPPSIKGALRFWTRAICLRWPFDNGSASHRNLLSRDEALFGGVTTGVQRSLVSVSIRHNSFQELTGRELNLQSGGKYLWYSLIVDGYQQDRKGIAASEPFAVTLQSKDEIALKKAVAAFWMLTYFGSLGTRARRGTGSFEVVCTEGYSLPEGVSFSPGSDIKSFLFSGIQSVYRIFDISRENRSVEYSTLGRVWVSKGFNSWERAIDNIGQIMLSHRKANPNRNRSLRKFTMDTLNQKAAFGLPVGVYEDHSVNFSEASNEKYSRRASPVCIGLVKQQNQIHWVVSELQGNLTPDGVNIEFHSKNSKATCRLDYEWEDADSRLLGSFFQKLTSDGYAINLT
jgi:CRISPR-associated protein Cmr1